MYLKCCSGPVQWFMDQVVEILHTYVQVSSQTFILDEAEYQMWQRTNTPSISYYQVPGYLCSLVVTYILSELLINSPLITK